MLTPILSHILYMLLGFSSIIGQLIILRELPTVFYGNELSFGIILTSWLFWTSIGSGLFGKFSCRINRKINFYTGLLIIGLFLLPATLIIIRLLREWLHLIPGEIVSIKLIFLTSFLIVMPNAMLNGFLFTLLPQLPQRNNQADDLIIETNKVYILESAGALLGCLYFYYIGAQFLNSFQNILISNLISLFGIFALRHFTKTRTKRVTFFIMFLLFSNIIWLAPRATNLFFHEKAFNPLQLVSVQESRYGSIVTTRQGNDNMAFFENGLALCATDDILHQEETTQFPLLLHNNPKDILLLGGGICGALNQIFMHDAVKRVDYVELDPALIKETMHLAPEAIRSSLSDSRVSVHITDARLFINKTTKRFDVIISMLPQPYTLQVNRYYTKEFFALINSRLNTNGIFSFSINSSENYIDNDQAMLLRSIYDTLARVFTNIEIVPGDATIFLASNDKKALVVSSDKIVHKIEQQNLPLKFVNRYYLPSRLSEEKKAYVDRRINETYGAQINHDLKPVTFYYDMILWSNKTSRIMYLTMKSLLTMKRVIFNCYLAFTLFLIFCILRLTNKENAVLVLTVGAVGLTEISLEVIVILLFQIFWGYVYSFIGIIIGSYMLGLIIGSFYGQKISTKKDNGKKTLIRLLILLEGAMIVLPLSLIGVVKLYYISSPLSVLLKPLLSIFILCAGYVGGMQFPVVNTLYMSPKTELRRKSSLGNMYAADLIGSSVGAFFISVLYIPLFGIYTTLIALTFLNLGCIILLSRYPVNDLKTG